MLSKSRRLSRLEFNLTKNQGTRKSYPYFSVIIQPFPDSPGSPSRFSVVTSSKFNSSAVVRNKFRRLIYGIFSDFPSGNRVIFYPKPSMLKLSDDQVRSLVTSALSPLFGT